MAKSRGRTPGSERGKNRRNHSCRGGFYEIVNWLTVIEDHTDDSDRRIGAVDALDRGCDGFAEASRVAIET